MTTIPYWPHIWAIPLTLVAGAAIGWILRGVLGGARFAQERRLRDEED